MASDTSMNTPDESTGRGPKSIVAKPDFYYGDRNKLENWILQFDTYFHINDNIENDNKVVMVTTFMKGAAGEWVKPYLIRYMGDTVDSENTRMFEDWQTFKDKLRQIFSQANEPAIAERAIQQLRQTHSAADYANKFQQYSIQTNWNDAALMRMYRQGLKANVRIELMRSGASIETLNQLIDESIRISNDLFEFEMEARTFTPIRNQAKNQGYHHKPNQKQPRSRNTLDGVYNGYGPEGMHLDNIQRGAQGKTQRKNHAKNSKEPNAKETRSCYNCGKPGHLAKNCRQKNKVIREFNMITTDQEGAEEWEVISPKELGLDTPQTEPHPGNRVLTALDEVRDKNPTSPRYYYDLTEQAYVTPPESPTLRREDATVGQRDTSAREAREAGYANDGQALIINDVDWVTQEIQQYGIRQAAYRAIQKETDKPLKKQPQYHLDPRNPLHQLMSFTGCFYDDCQIHWSDKSATFFPQRKSSCKWQWYDCPRHTCEKHLWDKRERNHFPSMTEEEEDRNRIMVNNRCTNDIWQTCLQEPCVRHQIEKQVYGFLPRREEEEPFLEERQVSTQHETATTHTLQSSLNSQ